jgi:thioredoxin reductase (NADPH)
MNPTVLDVVIVGAGPTGLATAIECQKAGLSLVAIEKGCLVNSLSHYPTEMIFFTTPELLEIGDIPMTSLRDKPNRVEALKYYRRVAEHFKLPVRLYERVEKIEGGDGDFRVHSETQHGERRLTIGRKLVLASGYYDLPNPLNVPGEDLAKVQHYYREAHPFFNSDVLIIGGKNSAAIAALDLYRHGARVTLVHRGAALHRNIKYWIMPDIENRIKSGEIRAYFNTTVQEIQEDRVLISAPSGPTKKEEWLKNDFVLALVGYHPDFDLQRSVGIHIDDASGRPECNPETLETNAPGVYLAGVLVAGTHTNEIFIENGRFHGRQIAADIARKVKAGN